MARKWGAGKGGIWGSIIGMVVGMFLFPPFGAILGIFAGAVLGELLAGKMSGQALQAGWGVSAGTMLALAVKLAVSSAIAFSGGSARLQGRSTIRRPSRSSIIWKARAKSRRPSWWLTSFSFGKPGLARMASAFCTCRAVESLAPTTRISP